MNEPPLPATPHPAAKHTPTLQNNRRSATDSHHPAPLSTGQSAHRVDSTKWMRATGILYVSEGGTYRPITRRCCQPKTAGRHTLDTQRRLMTPYVCHSLAPSLFARKQAQQQQQLHCRKHQHQSCPPLKKRNTHTHHWERGRVSQEEKILLLSAMGRQCAMPFHTSWGVRKEPAGCRGVNSVLNSRTPHSRCLRKQIMDRQQPPRLPAAQSQPKQPTQAGQHPQTLCRLSD